MIKKVNYDLKLINHANQVGNKAFLMQKQGRNEQAIDYYLMAIKILHQLNEFSNDTEIIKSNSQKIEQYQLQVKNIKYKINDSIKNCPNCNSHVNESMKQRLKERKEVTCEGCGVQIKEKFVDLNEMDVQTLLGLSNNAEDRIYQIAANVAREAMDFERKGDIKNAIIKYGQAAEALKQYIKMTDNKKVAEFCKQYKKYFKKKALKLAMFL